MVKTTRYIDKFLMVIQILLFALGIFAMLLIALTFIFSEQLIANLSTLNLGSVSVTIADSSYMDSDALKFSFIISLIATIILLMVT